jgi:hypothetical protein
VKRARPPLSVLITVDTEVWPVSEGWPHRPLGPSHDARREIDWYFHGGERRHGPGLAWQLATLRAAGLKASYFVDPLFSFALGLDPLREVVGMVEDAGQETCLHLHPEWLTDPRCPPLPAFRGPLLHAYAADDQRVLLDTGLRRLREAGASDITAFRAGSWGANRDTVRALASLGIVHDTSLNARFAASFPDLEPAQRERMQPFVLDGVVEVPVTGFVDRPPAGRRPLHVCAASFDEFRHVLDHAFDAGWTIVVVVMHSFEFVRVDRLPRASAPPQRLIARRFERLCSHLASQPDRFVTAHFRDLDRAIALQPSQPALPRSSPVRTAARHVEQLVSRLY